MGKELTDNTAAEGVMVSSTGVKTDAIDGAADAITTVPVVGFKLHADVWGISKLVLYWEDDAIEFTKPLFAVTLGERLIRVEAVISSAKVENVRL